MTKIKIPVQQAKSSFDFSILARDEGGEYKSGDVLERHRNEIRAKLPDKVMRTIHSTLSVTARIVTVFLLLASISARAADFVVVIDTSGSMKTQVPGKGKSRIEVVQAALVNFLVALPVDSRVKLISFNNKYREQEFILHTETDRRALLDSVAALHDEPNRNGGTKLYLTLRHALAVARDYARQNPGEPVDLRVLTDGQDDSRKAADVAIPEILREFPEVDQQSIRPNLVLCGDWNSSLIVRVAEKLQPFGMEVSDASNMGDPLFPPVIVQSPDPAEVGRDTMFADNSATPFARYEWEMDGKTIGHGKSLVQNFNDVERHQVAIVGISSSGKRLRAVKTVHAKAAGLAVDFALSATVVEPNEEVRMFGRAVGKVEKWAWFVDGKSVANTQDATTKLVETGEHTIKVVVADATQAQAETAKTVLVRLGEFAVEFKAPSQAVEGLPVQFAIESVGKIGSNQWSFGDKTGSSERNPAHVFRLGNAGIAQGFVVELTAASMNGQTSRAQHAIRIVPEKQESAPKAAFSVKGGLQQKAGVPAQVLNESTGKVDRQEWTWGEGTTSSLNPEITFKTPGPKIVRLTVVGPGGTDSVEQRIVVLPRYAAPKITAITAVPAHGKTPIEVTFTARTSGDVAKIVWKFADGKTVEGASVKQTVTTPGDSIVEAIAMPVDPEHANATAKFTFHASAPLPVWVWIVAALAVVAAISAGVWSKVKPMPIFGTLSWMENGVEKKVSLSGTVCDLAKILPAAVVNGSQLEVRNRQGMSVLKDGVELQKLKRGDRFKVGQLNISYYSDL